MSELDLYYRAFREYSTLTKNNEKTRRLSGAVKKASSKDDTLEAIRTRCIIEEDWVKTIEQLLPFVDNAIREDRQFIRTEGEVVLIEKAKKVSKASVSHLARHSDMITHLPDDPTDTLVPDKIYMVENQSNYAIYENRFLYMLLCYLRDFVELRYSKIAEYGNTYNANFVMKRKVHVGKRTLTYDVVFQEQAKNDPRSSFDKDATSMIERLETIRVWVTTLLMTPLMNEVSKAPMLRPPVTRTNVLKMDNNFKNAVELYDYLAAYTGDGYRLEEIKKTISPFHDSLADSVSELVPLTSFFVYQYGNDLEDELLASFKKEEERRKLEESERQQRKIQEMKRRLEETGESPETYMLMLEERNRELEIRTRKLTEKNGKLTASVEQYARTQEMLTATVQELQQREQERIAEIQAMTEAHAAELEQLHESHAQEIAELNTRHTQEVTELNTRHTEERTRLVEEHTERVSSLTESYETRIAADQETYRGEKEQMTAQIAELTATCEDYAQRNLGLQARVHAWQYHKDVPAEEDLTSKEYFKQLEKERAWFEKMFEGTWKDTRKRIRKDLLWTKPAEEPKKKSSRTKKDVAEEAEKEEN